QRHLAPDDVEVLRRAFLVQAGADPEDRGAPIGPDHEVAADLVRAGGRLGANADDAPALAHEVARGRATLEAERREAARLGHEHLEDRRLRDDARALDAEVGDRDAQETARAAVDFEPAHVRLREAVELGAEPHLDGLPDRKSTRLNSSHVAISYAVFCLKKKKKSHEEIHTARKHNF